jgi:hypothetical protein
MKIREIKIREIKIREIKIREIKIREIKICEIKICEIKIREIKIRKIKTREIESSCSSWGPFLWWRSRWRPDWRAGPGVDFMKPFRPKFTDETYFGHM